MCCYSLELDISCFLWLGFQFGCIFVICVCLYVCIFLDLVVLGERCLLLEMGWEVFWSLVGSHLWVCGS